MPKVHLPPNIVFEEQFKGEIKETWSHQAKDSPLKWALLYVRAYEPHGSAGPERRRSKPEQAKDDDDDACAVVVEEGVLSAVRENRPPDSLSGSPEFPAANLKV